MDLSFLPESFDDDAPGEQNGDLKYCAHEISGPCEVLVDFECGDVTNIRCAHCGLSLPLMAWDQLEFVRGEDVPMVLTTTVEEYFHPLDMIRPEYDTYHTLTASESREEAS